MTKFDELLAKRRSIRAFDSAKKVSEQDLTSIVRAAVESPSWKNRETSRYHIVVTEKMKAEMLSCLSPRNADNSIGASALIVSTFVKGIAGFENDGTQTNELGDGWGIYDAGISNSFALMKAADLGIDTLVMGIRDAGKIRALLKIPGDEVILSVIAVGYRLSDPEKPLRKDLSEILTFH